MSRAEILSQIKQTEEEAKVRKAKAEEEAKQIVAAARKEASGIVEAARSKAAVDADAKIKKIVGRDPGRGERPEVGRRKAGRRAQDVR